MKTSDVILGVMGAAAVGVILGVLFAPEKGSETRKKIAQKSKDYTDQVKDKLSKISDTVSSTVSSVTSGDNNPIEEIKRSSHMRMNDPTSEV
jgi:gas vesicle protein